MQDNLTQSGNSNPTITWRMPTGATMTGPLNSAPPQVQLLYQQLPQAQAATSTAISGASSAASGATVAGVQAKQAPAQINLGADLANKMTLNQALKKYTPLGQSPDDIFKQYLASSPWGLPNESPSELRGKGISDDAVGKIGDNGSFADKWNTKQAILGMRDLHNTWNQTDLLSHVPFLGNYDSSAKAYNTQKAFIGNHLSSLIPGASGAQATGESLSNSLPNTGDVTAPSGAAGQFSKAEEGLLNVKGYKYSDLGLTAPAGAGGQTNNVSTLLGGKGVDTNKPIGGGDLLRNLLQVGLPTAGGIAGGLLGGVAGAAVPVVDVTGAPEVAGAIAGSGIGSGGGQALADVLTGKKIGADVPITGALGAAGEGVGAGIGALLGKAGGAIGDYGSNLISKNLNLTPKIAADAAGDMGVKSIPNFLSKEGLQGANYEKLSSAVEPIQGQFDAIAKNPNIKIAPSDVIDGFDKQIKSLQDSILPSDHAKANVLQTISDNFANKFKGVSQIGADAMTALRQTVDKGVKDFGSDPMVSGPANLTRGIIQKSIQDADPSNSLDALGTRLHQYYTLLGKAEPRQFVSAAKPLLSVKDAAAAVFGNALGGPLGGAGVFGLEKMLSSQTGTNALSLGARGLGKIIGSGAVKQGARMSGAGIGSGIGAILGLPQ